MSYIVAHFRKIKTAGGLSAVAKHNARDGIGGTFGEHPPWLTRTDRTDLNVLNESDVIPPDRLFRRRSQQIEKLSRKPQKNAAVAVEAVYSASPEFFEGKNPEEIYEYFNECLAWNRSKFGDKNELHWAIHWDETTPHMHVLMTPITRKKRVKDKLIEGEKWRYSSGDFLGGKHGLRNLQTSIAEEVGEKWGLSRGVEKSKARHTDQAQWASELRKKELELSSKSVVTVTKADRAVIKHAILFYNKDLREGGEAVDWGLQHRDVTKTIKRIAPQFTLIESVETARQKELRKKRNKSQGMEY